MSQIGIVLATILMTKIIKLFHYLALNWTIPVKILKITFLSQFLCLKVIWRKKSTEHIGM